MRQYEKICDDAKDINGYVSFPNFLKQLNIQKTPRIQVEHIWRRLLSQNTQSIQETWHPKGLAMAVLYMLHIESYSDERPRDENNIPGAVSHRRRKLLKLYGNWVMCQCEWGCGKQWSFSNDVGLWRVGGAKRKCVSVKLLENRAVSNLLLNTENALQQTRRCWENSSC